MNVTSNQSYTGGFSFKPLNMTFNIKFRFIQLINIFEWLNALRGFLLRFLLISVWKDQSNVFVRKAFSAFNICFHVYSGLKSGFEWCLKRWHSKKETWGKMASLEQFCFLMYNLYFKQIWWLLPNAKKEFTSGWF